jgi:hypothetical protein
MATSWRGSQVKVVSGQEVAWMRDKGGVIVDIRPEADYGEVRRLRCERRKP